MQMISYIQENYHLNSDIESNENVQNIFPKFKKMFSTRFEKKLKLMYIHILMKIETNPKRS